jgi:caffeoylshikimate esterase
MICVGYGDNLSWLARDRAVRLARAGYAVYGIDYEGVGKSDGEASTRTKACEASDRRA